MSAKTLRRRSVSTAPPPLARQSLFSRLLTVYNRGGAKQRRSLHGGPNLTHICPHCGSSETGQPADGAGAHCSKCGSAIDQTTSQSLAALAVQSPEFDDLDEVLRDTAAPLNDIDDILSEVRAPEEKVSSNGRGGLLVRFALAVFGLAVAGLLVLALGKIAEFADEPANNKVATAGGAVQPPEQIIEPADTSSTVGPINHAWKPEAEWFAQLGPPASLGEYELRLPQDYTRIEQANSGGKTTCSFRSSNRPADDINVVTAGIEVYGVLLASYEERRMIVLSFVCTSPPGSAEYRRLENSLLTFRPAP
jgi:transcription elongation factor Elf1